MNKPDGKRAGYQLPPTVSRAALLERGSDRRFRQLVYDLLTVAARMESVRGHLGERLTVSGPQYSILMAVAQLQGEEGVSVSAIAQAMHVTRAFVASESGKLAQRGFLLKQPNPRDRRGVLLRLAPTGRLKIDRLSVEVRAINDLFFGTLDAAEFAAMASAATRLVAGSQKAMQHLAAVDASEAITGCSAP
jgi:DNA-binding MarR family transcriptional regulator